MAELPQRPAWQHIDHGLQRQCVEQRSVALWPQPACQWMPAVRGRYKDATPRDAQQFAQQPHLPLMTAAGFDQLMAGDPVEGMVVIRQARMFAQGQVVETAQFHPRLFGVVAGEGIEGLVEALPALLQRARDQVHPPPGKLVVGQLDLAAHLQPLPCGRSARRMHCRVPINGWPNR